MKHKTGYIRGIAYCGQGGIPWDWLCDDWKLVDCKACQTHRRMPIKALNLECMECGKRFKRKNVDSDVACPHCNGVDVELE